MGDFYPQPGENLICTRMDAVRLGERAANDREGVVPQPVMAILSQQDELAAKARKHTGDVNEAGLLVGKVISRAFRKFEDGESTEVISAVMRRDLDMLIRQQAS